MRECLLYRLPMAHPGDVSGLAGLLEGGHIQPSEIVAIFGKTEGNGCVNDFTRPYAVASLQTLMAQRLQCSTKEVEQKIAMVMSGGTEGALSPHMLVLAVRESALDRQSVQAPRLAIGTAFTRMFLPSEIGRLAQVDATAEAVRAAMKVAAIDATADVHFVQIKCPLLTSDRIAQTMQQGGSVATHDTYESMGFSRGASALGVAVALGEIDRAPLRDEQIARDLSLWSARASASAGIELMRSEIIVLGNSPLWSGHLLIGHEVMEDAIDLPAILRVLRTLGLTVDGQLSEADMPQVVAALVKADPARSGRIRGKRHVMWDDSDINATRHARALVGGVVAAAIGCTDLFVSGGAEHQGPDGGGPVAVVVDLAYAAQ